MLVLRQKYSDKHPAGTPCRILRLVKYSSQSGYGLWVRMPGGDTLRLDLGWFEQEDADGKPC